MNHEHYRAVKGVTDVDVVEELELPGHLGHALKYIWRCRFKGTMREDITKAIWWLNRWLEYTEKQKG